MTPASWGLDGAVWSGMTKDQLWHQLTGAPDLASRLILPISIAIQVLSQTHIS